MKYTVVVHFCGSNVQDLHDETFNVDNYSHNNGILELLNYDGKNIHIKIFSLSHLLGVDITQIGE